MSNKRTYLALAVIVSVLLAPNGPIVCVGFGQEIGKGNKTEGPQDHSGLAKKEISEETIAEIINLPKSEQEKIVKGWVDRMLDSPDFDLTVGSIDPLTMIVHSSAIPKQRELQDLLREEIVKRYRTATDSNVRRKLIRSLVRDPDIEHSKKTISFLKEVLAKDPTIAVTVLSLFEHQRGILRRLGLASPDVFQKLKSRADNLCQILKKEAKALSSDVANGKEIGERLRKYRENGAELSAILSTMPNFGKNGADLLLEILEDRDLTKMLGKDQILLWLAASAQNRGVGDNQSGEPAKVDGQTISQTTLVQRFWPEQIVNYIGIPAFHARSWRIGEKLQIGNQQFTIKSIRISGSGSKKHGTLASFDIVVLTEKPMVNYQAGTPVRYLGRSIPYKNKGRK